MYMNVLTREMVEAANISSIRLPHRLPAEERCIKVPLAIATTLPNNPEWYQKPEEHLRANGWKVLGQKENPNSGNLLTLWYKKFSKNRRLTLAEWRQEVGNEGVEAVCCGLNIYNPPERVQETPFLAIARVPKGQTPPRGWQRFACFRDCGYWTNVRKEASR